MAYGITVHQLDATGRRADLAYFTEAPSAPEMEDTVTRLHQEFPAPTFEVEVGPIKSVSWRGGPQLDRLGEAEYDAERDDYDT